MHCVSLCFLIPYVLPYMFHLYFWKAISLIEELSPTGPQLQSHSFGLLGANGSWPLKHFCFASWYDVKFCHWRHTLQECFASCFWFLHCRWLPQHPPTVLSDKQQPAASSSSAPKEVLWQRLSASREMSHKQLSAASQSRDFQQFLQCCTTMTYLPSREPEICPPQ